MSVRIPYCAGLPLEGERPLSADDLARAAAMRRAWRLRAVARLLLVPLSLALGVAVGAAAAAATEAVAQVLVAAAFVVFGLAGPIWAVQTAAGAIRTFLRLGRDVRGAVALRFSSADRAVVVLPHSRFVLEWDGVPAAGDRRLAIGDAAEVPASAATYAVDARTAATAPGLAIVRRPLSPAEREEIAAHARRLGRVPIVLVVFTGAFLLLSGEVLGARERGAAGAGLALVWALLLAYAWWRFTRARSLSRKLLEDASNGWALRATAGAPAGSEVLAVSGVSWTAQGAPAPWRTQRGPRIG